jgi:hypothetical protein
MQSPRASRSEIYRLSSGVTAYTLVLLLILPRIGLDDRLRFGVSIQQTRARSCYFCWGQSNSAKALAV